MSESNGILYSAAPPNGVTPDYSLPYQATPLVVCNALFFPIALIFTAARIWTRVMIIGKLALDDFMFMNSSWLLIIRSIDFLLCDNRSDDSCDLLTGTIFDCALVKWDLLTSEVLSWGLGKHVYNVPLDILYGDGHFSEINVLAAIFFCGSTGFAKTSILLFYLRIFPSKAFAIVIYSFTAVAAGYSLASVLANIFSCTPVRASWDIAYASVVGNCIDRPVFYLAQASLGIMVDVVTLIAPLPLMYKLQLPIRQKLAILAILSMGAFVCIISIIRLQSLRVLLVSTDLTGDTPNALMWCVLEINFSIIGGCAPTIKPLLRRYVPFILGGSSAKDKTTYGTGHRKHRTGTGTLHNKSGFRLESLNGKDNDAEDPTTSRGFTSTKIGASHELPDNSSEEFIFRPQDASRHTHITRTVEFETSYEVEDDRMGLAR